MGDRIQTPTSVVAEANNYHSIREGAATAEMYPGTGCTVTEDEDGHNVVEPAEANSETRRIVREQRNPPRSITPFGQSPLDQAYDEGNHTETVGPLRNDRARLRLSEHASTDPEGERAGWDEDGFITDEEGTIDGTDPLETFIGTIIRVIERDDEDDLAVVEVN